MKMVKSLLLGSAAGLVAIASAQAADLPVKAKPVQYVKICSLYGAGFYYIPGTDICLKVGGWVRAEYMWGVNGSTVATMINNVNNRNTTNNVWRSRGYITADARNQTAYGTVRGYIAVGLSTTTTGGDNAANQFDANRAFIQWAGFTFGRAVSFYDYMSNSATSYWGNVPFSDTGDGGHNVAAYTAQFGNGFSATISAENRRNTQIIAGGTAGAFAAQLAGGAGTGNVNGASFSTAGSTTTGFGAYGGWQSPDIVANIRLDQAWGGAQLMGALHQVNNNYYVPVAAGGGATGENSGHAADKWGFVVGAGLRLNAPMIGPGDYFQAQINYTEGALRYLFMTTGSGNWYMQRGQRAALGVIADAVVGGTNANGATTGTNAELTKAWGFNAAYEHFWNPAWRTSVYGGYTEVKYSGLANAIICTAQGLGAGAGNTAVAVAGCNNDWSTWHLGSRTQWNVTKDFYMGLDVVYQRMTSASTPTGFLTGSMVSSGTSTAPGLATAVATSSMDNWSARFRVHRDFMP